MNKRKFSNVSRDESHSLRINKAMQQNTGTPLKLNVVAGQIPKTKNKQD